MRSSITLRVSWFSHRNLFGKYTKEGDSWCIDRDQLRAYFQGEKVAAESEEETLREINKLGAEADIDEAKQDGQDAVRALMGLSRKAKENTSC